VAKKIAVVTGYAGFIGSTFTEKLLEHGWHVYCIDKFTYVSNTLQADRTQQKYYDRMTWVREDICDINWLPECDVIFNLAAESDVDVGNRDAIDFVKSNIEGVRNLLSIIQDRILIRTDKPLFFQVSTDEVYGDIKEGSFDESAVLNPSNPYAATKAAADLLIQSWARTHGLEYIIARPSNNFGLYQYPEKLIPLSCKRLSRGKKIKLHNKGTPVRTWTHAEDTAEALITLYEKAERNRVYNISSEFEQTNYETITKLINYYFLESINRQVPDLENHLDLTYERPGQDVRYAISCDPLRALGWEPKKIFDKELPKIVKYYKENWKW
tara:strand:+ start:267 stop:1244 length:978 start_codon:yes stop_codon:yes gene_type:complete